MADTAPADLAITITDPIKNDQGMLKSYISYKVNTETTLDVFADKQFSVIRRYSEFEWLQSFLRFKLPGVIVPPLPEKALTGNYSPEFIEGRRRALERFMGRCAEHPHIRDDETFRLFLSAEEDKLKKAKDELKKEEAAASSGGGFFSSVSPLEKVKSDEDKAVEEVEEYVANLNAQMVNVAKHTGALMKRGKELSQGLFDFGLAFTMLGQHETEALNGALSSMGHTADQLSLIAADQVEKETRWFAEPITDYIQLLGAVKEAVNRRNQMRKAYFCALGDLESKTSGLAKLKAAAGTPAADAKIPAMEQALAAAEVEEASAKAQLGAVTDRLLGEVARFKAAKADDMRKVVLDYVQLQIEYNKQMEALWAKLIPEIEGIQVEAVPKVTIFDGPVENKVDAAKASEGDDADAGDASGGGAAEENGDDAAV